jgi:hypothetical protein
MKKNLLIEVPLWALVILGFVGALKVSYANFTGSPCPYLFMIPICYVVLAAYALMLASMIINHSGCRHHFFCMGWGTAFVIAFFASIAELVSGGGICPVAGGASLRGANNSSVPLCFISLIMLIIILVLFIKGPYKRACDISNRR